MSPLGNIIPGGGSLNWDCCSVAKPCPTLWDYMNCSTPGFPFLHHLPQSAQTHVHWVIDTIQLSHSLLPPSPPALNLSQHQGLFWMSQLFAIRWPKYWNFSFSISPSSEYIQGWFSLQLTDLISLLSKGLSTVFSSTTILMFFSHVAGKMKWKKDKKLMAQCGPNSCLFSPSLDSSLGGNTRDH